MHTIALCNLKGGVGKTTVTFNLAAALAEAGHSVLAIDADPQGCLSRCFEAGDWDGPTLADVLRGQSTVATTAVRTKVDGVWLVPSSPALGSIQRRNMAGERVLQARMGGSCEFVLIDCPGHPGVLLANALTAADGILVPTLLGGFAGAAIERVLATLKTARGLKRARRLDLIGLLANRVPAKSSLTESRLAQLRETHGALVFETTIQDRDVVIDSIDLGKPVLELAPQEPAAEEFRAAAAELIRRIEAPRETASPPRRLRVMSSGAGPGPVQD